MNALAWTLIAAAVLYAMGIVGALGEDKDES